MEFDRRSFDDGEVSIRGNVYYDAPDTANLDYEPDDLSDHISIHSSYDDYHGLVLVRSHSAMDGFERLSGHPIRNYGSPSQLNGSWYVRSEAASAPPDFAEARMISDDRYNARENFVSMGHLRGNAPKTHADTDFRRAAATSNALIGSPDLTRHDDRAGGARDSRRDINETAGTRVTRRGNGAGEASGLTRRTRSAETVATRTYSETVGGAATTQTHREKGGESTRQTNRSAGVDVDRLQSAVRSTTVTETVHRPNTEIDNSRQVFTSSSRTDSNQLCDNKLTQY
jgi:hypothetical protein